MKEHDFIKGMGLGILAGAAAGLALTPGKRRSVKKAAGKAVKTMEEVMDNLSSDLGL